MGRRGTSRRDWVEAGQALLIEGGIDAVKLSRLTCALGVSTGSFYHHFGSFDDYLTALAEFYGAEQARVPIDEAREMGAVAMFAGCQAQDRQPGSADFLSDYSQLERSDARTLRFSASERISPSGAVEARA